MEKPEVPQEAMDLYVRAFTALDPLRFYFWSDMGLTTPQLRVIFLLRENAGMSAGEVATSLGVTPPTVSGIVDRLVRMDLVRRDEDPSDRRLVRNYLTEKGQVVCGEVERDVRLYIQAMLGRLSQDELARVMEALKILVDLGDRMKAEGGMAAILASTPR